MHGWENAKNTKQGFGLYVRIKDDKTGYRYYFGHLSKILVKVGEHVKITQEIGIEGNTGYVKGINGGYHCHYEIRKNAGVQYKGSVNVSSVSGIPNAIGVYDDGYKANQNDKIDKQVNYLVRIKVNTVLNVRAEPSTSSKINQTIKNGVYTIVEENFNEGRLWGKLKSGAGWIALEYTEKL